ncbi:acyl carrier protein [Wenjunlia tyrosinilytica]|uniref:Acyl carrier protein n=1 Tax=Wenjunlia tyrosinilytica TaxID=1544741 RepID=A0A917ZS63_9ACTN|nr:acyl carrier protein [Wenjunlia tyrosinilytica]GGO89892.1 putative acyl carrier protein [Wenjunlia tyrosinilytica]
MSSQLTFSELASLMKSCAGLTVDPKDLEKRPDCAFAEYNLDSLGLLGIVSELEKRYGKPIPAGPETCKTPGEFVEAINASLMAGA